MTSPIEWYVEKSVRMEQEIIALKDRILAQEKILEQREEVISDLTAEVERWKEQAKR